MLVSREEMLQSLESVSPGLSPKEIVEQTSCFVFRDGLVHTYNEEVACRLPVNLKITAAVKAEPLLAVLSKMTEEEIDISVKESELIIKGKKRLAAISLDAEIRLPIDSIDRPKKWADLPDDFVEAVAAVHECAGTKKDVGFATLCIHVHPKFMEACDNFQAIRYKLKTTITEETIVKASTLRQIIPLGVTEMSESGAWLHFRNPNGLIISCRRHTEDLNEFSSLDTVYEMKNAEGVTLPQGLSEAAEKAQIFSAENTEKDLITVSLEEDRLILKGQSISGWYKEEKKLRYEGRPIKFTIRPNLLIEVLKRHNECEINETKLRVNTAKFVYMTVLNIVEDK